MLKNLALTLLFTISINQPTHAQNDTGIYFSHQDWEIACDNTRTCRAAGYQGDNNELSVSVLLTRMAGADEPAKGRLQIGDAGDGETQNTSSASFKAELKVNNKNYGKVQLSDNQGDLSADQVTALVNALGRASNIEFVVENKVWHLSDKGAAAVLLKMDEFQGRIRTIGALIKKGHNNEAKVLKSLPKPVIHVPKIAEQPKSKKQLSENDFKVWLPLLKKTSTEDDCELLFQSNNENNAIQLIPLSGGNALLSTLCWRAAYNEGYGYWLINRAKPKPAVLVTNLGSDYDNGVIFSSQKGRGIGDCFSHDSWAWNGKAFIHAESSTTGMCKAVAAGGAWDLPTLSTDVRH